MGRRKAGSSPKNQHVSTSIESSVLDMPDEKEELDVTKFKGSNQITKESNSLQMIKMRLPLLVA
jgi:hypothetical protein